MMRLRSVAWLLVLPLILTACGDDAADVADTSSASRETEESSLDGRAPPDEGDGPADGDPASGVPVEDGTNFLQRASELQKRICVFRRLYFPRPVEVVQLGEAEMRGVVGTDIYADIMTRRLNEKAAALLAVGGMGLEDDLRAAVIDLREWGLSGAYDRKAERLCVLEGAGDRADRAREKSALAYYMMHALADQHFDLDAFEAGAKNDDQRVARRAVIEGHASFYMLLFSFEGLPPQVLTEAIRRSPDQADALADFLRATGASGHDAAEMSIPGFGAGEVEALFRLPKAMADEIVFTRTAGAKLVHEAFFGKVDFGPVAVAKLFRQPPTSTEQILHPEKCLAAKRDEPTTVTLPDVSDLLGEGWSLLYSDVLGELGVKTLVHRLGADRPYQAHSGWDGDSIALYRKGPLEQAVVWVSVWDSQLDAAEFAVAASELLQKRRTDYQYSQGGLERLYANKGDLRCTVAIDGHRVFVLEETPASATEPILRRLKAKTKLVAR